MTNSIDKFEMEENDVSEQFEKFYKTLIKNMCIVSGDFNITGKQETIIKHKKIMANALRNATTHEIAEALFLFGMIQPKTRDEAYIKYLANDMIGIVLHQLQLKDEVDAVHQRKMTMFAD